MSVEHSRYMFGLSLLLCLSICPLYRTIEIGALLPNDTRWPFSKKVMLQAAEVAIRRVQGEMKPELSIKHRDSKCSEVYGMNQAINFVIEDRVEVLFGPICDFAAAPVARQVTFWNIPMVTVGAIAWDFKLRHDDIYPLLTRAGTTNLYSLTEGLIQMMYTYQWAHFKLIYSRNYDGGSVTPKLCHLMSETLVLGVKEIPSISLDYLALEDKASSGLDKMLLEEVDNKFSGEWNEVKVIRETYTE